MSFTNHVQPVSSHETSRTPDHPVQFIGSSESSNDLFKKHFSRLYGFLLAAIGLASTLHHAFIYDPKHPVNFYEIFYIVIYAFAASVLICLLVWLHRMKKLTLEKTGNSNLVGYDGEGFNLYLKGGVILFSVISVIYNLIRIVSATLSGFDHCGGVAYLFFCLSQAAFVSLLALFLILHDRVVIREPTFLIRLFFIHILVCCICTWFHAGIGEIRERIANEDATKNKSTSFHSHDETELPCQGTIHELILVRPYLLPALVEFALLGAPMVYELLHQMDAERSDRKEYTESMTVTYPTLHKSKRGIVIGTVVVLVSITFIIALYFAETHSPLAAMAVYYCQCILYSTLALIVAVLTYCKLRRFGLYSSKGTTVDRHILWMSFFGSLLFGFLTISSAAYALSIKSIRIEYDILHGIELLSSLLNLLEMCLQTLVILNTMHRVVQHQRDVENKPGRGHIALLLCVNLSLWIIDTFEIKKATTLSSATEGNSSPYLAATTVLQHVVLPLVILFRFHSTVCLSLAWSRAFEDDHAIESSIPT